MTTGGYLLDNAAPAAGARLESLAEIASGRATAAEIDRHLASIDAGTLDLATSPMISAWGRRP